MTDIFRKKYRQLNADEIKDLDTIKDVATQLYTLYEKYPSRESSLAKTKLEESVMWAVKGITG